MTQWNGWETNPLYFKPLSGKEVKEDGTVFDVPQWRADLKALLDNESQLRNNQVHQRVYNPDSSRLLLAILDELKKMNAHLEIITEEDDL